MTLPVRFDPAALISYFKNNKNRTNDQIASYLADIAEAAKCLAEVWEDLSTELALKQGKFDARDQEALLLRMEVFRGRNSPHFSKLLAFYRNVSIAMNGKLGPVVLDEVVDRLGTLLCERENILRLYDQTITQRKDALFLSSDSQVEDFRDMRKLVGALQREAAALDVLAKTVKLRLG